MSFWQYLLVVLLSFSLSQCSEHRVSLPERPHQPWVFRSVLDAQPRILTIALHDDLWLAYQTKTGSLVKAWRGGVNFDGAVYTTVHGPQPSSLGDAWFENVYPNPWRIVRGKQEERPEVQFRGHRFQNGQVRLLYELRLNPEEIITVAEKPEYVTNEFGQTGLQRTFTTANVPEGVDVLFLTNMQALPTASNLRTNAEWVSRDTKSFGETALVNVDGALRLVPNGTTELTALFAAKPMLPNANKVVGAEDEERRPLGYRLIARSDCRSCHNTYLQTIGPSYVDVATRYRNTEDNVEMLVNKVLQGGAGNWGEAAMTPHPDLPPAQARAMVEYIMSLDAEEEAALAAIEAQGGYAAADVLPATDLPEQGFLPGAVARAIRIAPGVRSLDDINWSKAALFAGVIPHIEFYNADFGDLTDHFAIEVTGYLRIPKTNNYTFRLTSDDGSALYIDDQLIIKNDGLHGDVAMDGEVVLAEGFHPVRVRFFESGGGASFRLAWRSFETETFEIVPSSVLMHRREDQPAVNSTALAKSVVIPGDGEALNGVHPSYTLTQARPDGFAPKVAGMDFLPDGRLVISTWDPDGAVYVLDGVSTGDPGKISYRKIASGLAEPLGLKVVDGDIYVLQKQELTHLIDHDGDEEIDEYRTLSNDWTVSANFHEFAFGLAFQEPYFYATLAIGILPGGASAPNQPKDRGKAVRIHRETGQMEIVAEGLRTPNGIGVGIDNEIFIADNQGDWLPACKILHLSEGAFFGSRAVDSARVSQLPMKPPVVWLPQDEIGNSPTTPSYLNDGPYAGQMIHGEVTHGGVKRVFVEKVNGEYQGAVFRFIQGLEAGINRLVWGPDSALYVGGIGSTGNWQHSGKLWYGLQRLKYNGKPTFEMLKVSARTNGMEIELTEALDERFGADPTAYEVQQWYYQPTADYGGPKLDQQDVAVRSVHISDDRKKIFLELPGLKEGYVVYIHLPYHWTSTNGQPLWSTEAWYTLN
ncbi:MAG: glycosyl hydrolase, partial [Bacteroidetes bacterium]